MVKEKYISPQEKINTIEFQEKNSLLVEYKKAEYIWTSKSLLIMSDTVVMSS